MTYPTETPWKEIVIISLAATFSAAMLIIPLYFWIIGKSRHSSWVIELLLLAGGIFTIPVNIYELKKRYQKREGGYTADIWGSGFYHGLKVFAISGLAASCLMGPLGILAGLVFLLFSSPVFLIPWTIAGAISVSSLNHLIMNPPVGGKK
jgi:hypothetical protein